MMKYKSTFSSKRRSLLMAGAGALLMPGAIVKAASSNYGILGQRAPELKLSTWIDGKGNPGSFKLSEHKGKFVFLEFWQAWCPGCHSHGFPTLKKITDEFIDNKYFVAAAIQTTFEGYSVNTPDKLREMQKRYDLSIFMGHDAGDEDTHDNPITMLDYRSGGTPWAVLISPQGIVIHNDFGISAEGAINYLNAEITKLI